MTSINSKMGLKPAGKRNMMKLPKDKARAVLLTAAKCPKCEARDARESRQREGHFWCTHCYHVWLPEVVVE